jgi:regulator of nucleoside diphosphate kinase
MVAQLKTEVSSSERIVITASDVDRLLGLIETAAARAAPEAADILAEKLDVAEPLPGAEVPADVVTMRSQVEFRDEESGRVQKVTLAYPGEEDIANGKISVLTPIGSALLGHAVGQSARWVTRGGKARSLTVLKVLFQPEASGRFDL